MLTLSAFCIAIASVAASVIVACKTDDTPFRV
jgi:hypothetical protein